MKVLIISLPRTGSTSLLEKISKDENIKNVISEPFGFYGNPSLIDFSKPMVVKTIINQAEKGIEFYKEWSKKFDKVVLLSRKNLKECAESCSYLMYNLQFGFKHDQEYVYTQPPNYKEIESEIYKSDLDIHTLGNLLNIKVQYYEDLFDVNGPNRQRKENIFKNII